MSMTINDTRCRDCGDRWIDAPGHPAHWCPPNETGFHVGDPVVAGGVQGTVQAINAPAGSIEVYFRTAGFRTYWYPAAQVQPAPTTA